MNTSSLPLLNDQKSGQPYDDSAKNQSFDLVDTTPKFRMDRQEDQEFPNSGHQAKASL